MRYFDLIRPDRGHLASAFLVAERVAANVEKLGSAAELDLARGWREVKGQHARVNADRQRLDRVINLVHLNERLI